MASAGVAVAAAAVVPADAAAGKPVVIARRSLLDSLVAQEAERFAALIGYPAYLTGFAEALPPVDA